jgi:hypothetical protein
MHVSSLKKIALSGMLGLSLVAGGLALQPAPETSAAYSKVLYTVYFDDGSGQGQTLRAQCEASAAQYGAISATAQVTHDARQVNGVWQNRLDCVGTFAGINWNNRIPITSIGVFAP